MNPFFQNSSLLLLLIVLWTIPWKIYSLWLAAKNNHKNVIVLAGKTNLKAELAIISNLNIMLSMDSGNAHIAAMLGVKVITLWGATHPFAGFQPFNQPDDFCLTSDRKQYPFLPTSVYGNKKVAGYENAMRTILPSKVIEKINSNLT